MPRTPARPGAWSLTELVALLALATLLGSFALVSLRENRRAASQSTSLANLRTLGAGYAAYALDASDRIATFTWRAGQSLSQYADLNNASDDRQAAGNQLVDILRRRSTPVYNVPFQPGLIPHLLYNHIVLLDYLGLSTTPSIVVSPGDASLRRWQLYPEVACGQPGNPCPNDDQVRHPLIGFRSSYRLPTAFISPDTIRNPGPMEVRTIAPSNYAHNSYSFFRTGPLGGRLVSEIRSPSRKVQLVDSVARDSSPQRYLLHNDARLPMLMADGAATVRRSGDSNPGTDPNSGAIMLIRYASPDPIYEAPNLIPGRPDTVSGRFLWTSMGLRGIDFDGDPTPWSPD